jgi:hypothetical protein
MADNTFPEDWRDQPCFLIAIPRPLVQYVAGLLKIGENAGFWATTEDFKRGYTAITELEECLMTTCLDSFLTKQDDLYRLINTAVRGQAYTVVTESPLVVTPAIEHAVELGFIDQNSVFGQLDRLTQLIDNRIAGTETPLYADLPGIKQQLEDVIAALGDDTDLTEIIAQLGELVVLLG